MKTLIEDLEKIKSLEKILKPGDVIIKQGEKAKGMFILLRGKIKVIQDNKIINEINEPGEYFGEISALLKIPHSATCIASIPSSVIAIPSTNIENFIHSKPEIGFILAKKLAKRLVLSDEKYAKIKHHIKPIEK